MLILQNVPKREMWSLSVCLSAMLVLSECVWVESGAPYVLLHRMIPGVRKTAKWLAGRLDTQEPAILSYSLR